MSKDFNTFTVFKKDGQAQLIKGKDAKDALNRNFFYSGSLKIIELVAPGDQRDNYYYDRNQGQWMPKKKKQ